MAGLDIAVVGAGLAGLTAAWLLGREHRVDLPGGPRLRAVRAHESQSAAQRMDVRVDEARDHGQSTGVDELGARVAGLAHRRVVAQRDDRAPRDRDGADRRRPRLERVDACGQEREVGSHEARRYRPPPRSSCTVFPPSTTIIAPVT